MFSNQRNRIILALGIIAFVLLPLTIALVGKTQVNRSKAASGTSLTFTPDSSQDNPVTVAPGRDVSLDLMVEPGDNNVVSFVKFVIDYDPAYFTVTKDDFSPNTDAFSETLTQPTITDGTITGSVSVGSDPLKAVTDPTKIGTLTLHAKKATGDSPTTVAYTSDSQVLSIGQKDDPKKSVLSSTGAAIITIGENASKNTNNQPTDAQESPAPSDSETPSDSPEPTTAEKNTQTPAKSGPTSAPDTGVTNIKVNALLHGIGAAGDSVNPTNSSLSNKSPKTVSRDITVALLDENGEDVARTTGTITYDSRSGAFTGTIPMDEQEPAGTYTVMLEVDRYLSVEMPNITVSDGKIIDLGDVSFTAGDIVPDDTLDVLDYNTLTDCGYGASSPLPMDDPKSAYQSDTCKKNENRANADLDDNGIIDSKDFNLFLREISKQSKQTSSPTDQKTSTTPTPTTAE